MPHLRCPAATTVVAGVAAAGMGGAPAAGAGGASAATCYDLFPFLLIYFLFCLSLCAAPCLTLFAFLCACFIAYLCVVLGHILHDT